MDQFQKQIEERKRYLDELIAKLEQQLTEFPEGKLRVSNNKGIPRYYWIKDAKDTRGKYISQTNIDIIQKLAQKDYIEKLYKVASGEYTAIEKYLATLGKENLCDVYKKLNNFRKELVTPEVLSDEMFVKKWEAEEYKINPYNPEEKVYPTQKDEMVRSKSEVMLADMYNELGIPYRYEAELCMGSGKKKYPDFTLLKVDTREIIYHEHLGLMDDEKYRKMNLMKLEEYRRNGIFFGKNLIVTFEADGCYLNIKEIRKMIKEFCNDIILVIKIGVKER